MDAEIFIPLVVVPAFLATVFSIFYMFFTTRHKERMMLIERGVDASIFIERKRSGPRALKIALLMAGLGMGLLLGSILSALTPIDEEVIHMAMMLLCGGAGLTLYYVIEHRFFSRNDYFEPEPPRPSQFDFEEELAREEKGV